MTKQTVQLDDARLRRLTEALRECCKTLYEIHVRGSCDGELVGRDYEEASAALDGWEAWARAEPAEQNGASTESRDKQFDSSAVLARLTVEAESAADDWDPMTQNHEPSFQRWSKQCYAEGYVSGAFTAELRANDKLIERGGPAAPASTGGSNPP